MPGTIQISGVRFYDEPRPDGEAGWVHYLILLPLTPERGDFRCLAHPGLDHWHEGQPFRIGPWKPRDGASPEAIAQNSANLWGWNGVKDPATLTLTPSLGLFPGPGRPYNAHLFLTNGRIQLCGDATVTVHPNPTPCQFTEEPDADA